MIADSDCCCLGYLKPKYPDLAYTKKPQHAFFTTKFTVASSNDHLHVSAVGNKTDMEWLRLIVDSGGGVVGSFSPKFTYLTKTTKIWPYNHASPPKSLDHHLTAYCPNFIEFKDQHGVDRDCCGQLW